MIEIENSRKGTGDLFYIGSHLCKEWLKAIHLVRRVCATAEAGKNFTFLIKFKDCKI